MRRVAAVIAGLLVLAASADAAPRGALSHEGRWVTDAKGRVMILHGWNLVSKVGSYRPEDSGLAETTHVSCAATVSTRSASG
jgi:endoglycosylceramidase